MNQERHEPKDAIQRVWVDEAREIDPEAVRKVAEYIGGQMRRNIEGGMLAIMAGVARALEEAQSQWFAEVRRAAAALPGAWGAPGATDTWAAPTAQDWAEFMEELQEEFGVEPKPEQPAPWLGLQPRRLPERGRVERLPKRARQRWSPPGRRG